MPTVAEVAAFLEEFAPVSLAESWDNVGLLLGRRSTAIRRIITCLTLTADVCSEAVAAGVGMIVTHHPILFRGTKTITDATEEGRLILKLIEHGIAVYSPHTAFDSTDGGINEFLAERLKLVQIQPLKPVVTGNGAGVMPGVGAGRCGEVSGEKTFGELLSDVRRVTGAGWLEYSGDSREVVRKIGIGCGAAEGFLEDARRLGCDVFLTGESRFHTVLQARANGVKLILMGHYWSERPAVEMLAERLAAQFPAVDVWASGAEHSPLQLWQQGCD